MEVVISKNEFQRRVQVRNRRPHCKKSWAPIYDPAVFNTFQFVQAHISSDCQYHFVVV